MNFVCRETAWAVCAHQWSVGCSMMLALVVFLGLVLCACGVLGAHWAWKGR